MNQQAAAADGIVEAGDPGDHIQQQGHTEPLAFIRSGPVQQVAVVFCGPQLDPAGLGRAVALRLGAGQGDNHPERTDAVRR